MYVYIFFICLFFDGHLGCFHLFAFVNNAAVNMGVQIPLHDLDFSSFGEMPINAIAGS